MKRSEMVRKIQKFIYDATDCDVEISEDEASLVLQFIERAGMLPPVYADQDVKVFTGRGVSRGKFNRWEPEVETKGELKNEKK